MTRKTTRALLLATALAAIGCAGERGAPGAEGTSVAIRTTAEPRGANCTEGGLKVEFGRDADSDGTLDDAEASSTAWLCNGATGAGGQNVTATAEPPGSNCAEGGVALAVGGGTPTYVCAGAPGADGQSVVVTPEATGPNCEHGGQSLQVGASSPTYVCNGAPGADGLSVSVTPEPSGPNCLHGGQAVQLGGSPPTYVCNGAPGADGQSVVVTPEATGPNCEHGGQSLRVGASSPTYVCNGAPGTDGLSVSVTPEPSGSNCQYGGQALQVAGSPATYVCNGAPGADGLSVTMTSEPPGTFCGAGGVKLQVGGGAPAYVCQGQSVTMVQEPAGANCEFGGVKLQVGTGPAEYVCNGAAPGVTRPIVQTAPVTDVRYVEAQVEGSVVSDGGELVLVRGIVLATHAAPTIADTFYLAGTGAGAFVTVCDGLSPATTYFVRAFATNALGTAYGDERSFTTRALTVPAIATHAASNLTTTTALSGGTIADDGGTPILDRGICWSTGASPALGGTCSSGGTGAGSFLAMATGLSPGIGYHLRAYAVNAQGASYGADEPFTTVVLPLATVTTASPSAVAHTTASVGGSVVSDNGSPVTSRGVCWSTSPSPTTADAKYAEAGGAGSFTAGLSGLATNMTYYARAFAVNGGGTSYGNQVTFTTLAAAAPSLSTKPVAGISNYMAGSGGVISSDGGSPILGKGVCWSLNPNPTTGSDRTNDGAGPGSYNSTLSGLSALTTYYVRAYAINAIGTAYGDELSFKTTDVVTGGPFVPAVGTTPLTMTGPGAGSGGGYVSSDGGAPVKARGLCWGTTSNPSVGGTCTSDGTGEGYFTSAITGLTGCNVIYYVRAYATNSVGTAYGNQLTIATGVAAPPTTDPATGIGYYNATSGGSVSDGGGCAITARGIAYGLSANPTVAGLKTVDGAGNGPFASNLTGLFANRTYYARAYATNAAGTIYGPQVVFATLEPSTPYVGGNFGGGTVVYLDGTGLHGLVLAQVRQGTATWGCSGTSIPTGTGIGTGASNTAAIVATCPTAGIAARIVDSLVLNGFDDWFLPSRDELAAAAATFNALGWAWPDQYTWSSSENNASLAAAYLGYNNSMGQGFKSDGYFYVRAMRAF